MSSASFPNMLTVGTVVLTVEDLGWALHAEAIAKKAGVTLTSRLADQLRYLPGTPPGKTRWDPQRWAVALVLAMRST